MKTLNVEHHRDLKCFVVGSEGQFAKLEYSRQGDGVTFTSTYVPFRLRGQGIAEALVEQGLSWAKDNNLNVSSTCWYVDKFLT